MDEKTFIGKAKKGEVRNPNGRPKSSRHVIHEHFALKYQEHFFKYGESALNRACVADPVGYLKIGLGLLPKEIKVDLTTDAESEGLSLLNKWLENFTTGSPHTTIENPSQERLVLSAPLPIEPEGRRETVDIREVPRGPTKPEWLS